MSPEKLIDILLHNGDESVDAFHLVDAFSRGFPIENLGKLLSSNSDRAIAMGAYVANELGRLSAPCVLKLTALFDHHCAQIRSDVIHALRACASVEDREALGRIILALDDHDPFVHHAAIFFILMNPKSRRLYVATHTAAELAPGTIFEEIAEMLPRNCWAGSKMLKQLVAHESPVVRRYAVGLACMPQMIVDAKRLDIANDCNDEQGLRMLEHIRQYPKPVGTRIARLDQA